MERDCIKAFLDGNGGCEYDFDVSAAALTSFRTGGNVSAVVYPRSADVLRALLRFLSDGKYKNDVLGCGSNVLVSDEGYDGTLVVTSRLTGIKIDGETLTAECGRGITSCASAAQKAGLSGLEFAYGIPGSVGGAVYMNAGAYGGEMKDVTVSVECCDPKTGEICTLMNSDLAFGYRDSALRRNGLTVLSATFALTTRDPQTILSEMNDYMSRRREKQPLEYPSAGSVFKRAPGHYTGKLIEDAGLKGYRIGGAEVSEKHAGFIVNRGGATASDIKELVTLIEDRVYGMFGVRLERELIYL